MKHRYLHWQKSSRSPYFSLIATYCSKLPFILNIPLFLQSHTNEDFFISRPCGWNCLIYRSYDNVRLVTTVLNGNHTSCKGLPYIMIRYYSKQSTLIICFHGFSKEYSIYKTNDFTVWPSLLKKLPVGFAK